VSDDGDFRVDFELSPILSATLGEYDSADSERPSLDEIINFAKRLAAISLPVDWDSWKKVYANRSPLFLEVIHHFRSGYEKQSPPAKIFHDLLEQKDVIQHWTPVLWAAYMGREQQLISLLENGADPFYVTQLGGNIFHQAAESANINVLNYLLRQGYHRNGADINLPDHWLETPLHVAAERSATLVTALLQHGARMTARQGDGELPLHYPRHLSDQQRLQSLASLLAVLARGSPLINAVDNLGCPPLFYFLDTPDCVKLLLDWAVDLTVNDHLGRNVLHHACLTDHSQSLSLLLDHYSLELINAKDRNGDTPLFTSLQNNSVYCSRILLRRAPISQLADKRGWTLQQYIVKMSDEVCLDLARSIPGVDLPARTR
jgi:ankyrin repeat protein